ncbi:MAG: SMC-Scp complex subunit ScpB [Longimicrobiales bacterium]
MRLTQIIEALLFASDAPLTAADLARIDERLDEDTVTAVIDELRSEYDVGERSFQVYDVAGGYQLLTRPEFAAVLERYDTVPQSSRLSTPALEVLAIIAYRQPLARAEIEEIRGVQSAAVLRTLQDRALIDAVGRSEGLGRPLLYGTTSKFLEHFGFRSLEDLPRPDELPVILRSRPIGGAEEAGATGDSAATAEGADAATEPSPPEASAGPGGDAAASGAQDIPVPEEDRTATASEAGVAGTIESDDGRGPTPLDGDEQEALSAREG